MPTVQEAKAALDHIIAIGRAHWYKPIHIAEVLYQSRTNRHFNTANLEEFRSASRRWRDDISIRLVGRRSTSSMRYQDDVWNDSAMPPRLLEVLDQENKDTGGAVERYIYLNFEQNISLIGSLMAYVQAATKETFDLEDLLARFEDEPGLKRSVDKAYEIVVYALFATLVSHLNATVTLNVNPGKLDLLREFEDFARMVLGVTPEIPQITQEARLYRVGVTNAADRGLDMWANFGPAVQVKHIALKADVVEGAANEIKADKMVLVCRQAEAHLIESVLRQAGLGDKIRGIITEDNLVEWYDKCLHGRYSDELAEDLLSRLGEEFVIEFPYEGEFVSFYAERRYDDIEPPALWQW
jgi:type II restriction enzyme